TWSLWRGYTAVTTTHGVAGGPQTVTKNLYFRGMDADSLATGDNQAMVWDSRRAGITSPILAPYPTSAGPGFAAAVSGPGRRCMEPAGAHTVNGTPIQLWDCNGNGWQAWQLSTDFNGNTVMHNAFSGRCLDT